jgi:hypothetical protein
MVNLFVSKVGAAMNTTSDLRRPLKVPFFVNVRLHFYASSVIEWVERFQELLDHLVQINNALLQHLDFHDRSLDITMPARESARNDR